MPIQLNFDFAEAQRTKLTLKQQFYIRDLYKQAAREIGERAKQAPRVPSDTLKKQYLQELQNQLNDRVNQLESELGKTIQETMKKTAESTVTDAKSFLEGNGLSIKGAYSHVPDDIVHMVISGKLYSGDWTLSKALWLDIKKTQQDIQTVIAQGIAENKSAFDIAKDLEKYVDPSAKKDWDWAKVYPGTKRKVDYNAQRLARTMVSHAYQQSFVRVTQKNPFVTKYKWETAGTERTCEICDNRNGKLFDKDSLPLDHPNGMCTFTAVMEDLNTISTRLANWAKGNYDPEIDEWYESIYN